MAQSTILTASNVQSVSTDVVVATGIRVVVGIFGAVGTNLPSDVNLTVWQDTPDGDNVYARLDAGKPQIHIVGPGTFRVTRPAYVGPGFGVFLET